MKRAGRPRKFNIGDHVRANDKAPGDYCERLGMITEIGPEVGEYRVELEDGETPTYGYEGINLSHVEVGDFVVVPEAVAAMLIREGWAKSKFD